MTISQEQIQTLAKLWALSLSPEQQAHLTQDLSSIVQFFDTLQAVDTSTPTQSPETHTHLRNDEVHLSMSTSDALLACSPQKVIAHQIAVAAVM